MASASGPIGTSGAVYPAAGFVQYALAHGARTLELNLQPSEVSLLFHESRQGPAGTLVPVLPGWALPAGVAHAVFTSRRGQVPAVRSFLDFLGERMRGMDWFEVLASKAIFLFLFNGSFLC